MAFAEQMRERDGTYKGDGQDAYIPALDDWLDGFRERILECADDLKIPCRVEEHQLHGVELHGRRSQFVQDSAIFTTINPSRDLCWNMRAAMKHDPDKRAVIAFSSSELRDQLLGVLGGAKTTVLSRDWEKRPGSFVFAPSDDIKRRVVPRMFAFLAYDENRMIDACTQAFRYPDCKDVTGQWHAFTPGISCPPRGQEP